MSCPLSDYYRCPEQFALLATSDDLSQEAGYFRFGDALGYGRTTSSAVSAVPNGAVPDVTACVPSPNGKVVLPFDLAEVVDNLRFERYPEAQKAVADISSSDVVHAAYYALRPVLPIAVRKHLQRFTWRGWRDIPFPAWPVDVSVERLMKRTVASVLATSGIREFPFIWFWPEGAPGCVMVTHDVEGAAGARFCDELMDLDASLGVPSAFQVVPDAPWASKAETARLVLRLQGRGFEVNVHDFRHDGRLFREREQFLRRAADINERGRAFGSRGFRSGAMYRRQDWFADLDFSYDMSVPNVAHLEPQRGGCCTVMPFFIGHLLELPLTAAQDYTVFHVLGEYSTRLWQQQIDLVLEQNGLVSFIAHPDYLAEARARTVYSELLRLLAVLRDQRGIWVALPSAIEEWWRQRREMRLVADGDGWRAEGPGSGRARVAHARLEGDRVVYEVAAPQLAA